MQHVKSRTHRSAMAKFRCGVAPIQLELGRYTGQAENDRICPTCNGDIETECHVLTVCPTYQDLRAELFAQAATVNELFNNMCSNEKFCFIMSNEHVQPICAKVCSLILKRRHAIMYQ